MIIKVRNRYILYSQTGKPLGSFATKAEALKRERQINFFKYQKKRRKNS